MDVPEKTTEEFVQAHLLALRNRRLRDKFVSTVAGGLRIRFDTERRIYGPDGKPIKIVQHVRGGTQVENGDHLHAVARPPTMRLRFQIRGR